MLTDNAPQQSLPFGASFEDFFNLDLMSGSSTSSNASTTSNAGPSSPSSHSRLSRSPQESTMSMPLTPPQPTFSTDDNLFNFNLDDDLFKPESYSSFTGSQYDLYTILEGMKTTSQNEATSSSASQMSGASSGGAAPSLQSILSSFDPSQPLSIDPQLMNAPAMPTPTSAHTPEGDEDEDEDLDDDQDDDDSSRAESVQPQQRSSSAGKANKGPRATTVQYGGVKKATGAGKGGKVSKDLEDERDREPPFERPSPEEYAKLSSKEKRQLRNKISARNFRTRRKEYIHTLEGDVAERDRIIDAIRQELSSTKSENDTLRQEVATLKKAIMEGRVNPMLPPPAPLSPMSPMLVPMSPMSPVMGSSSLPSTSNATNGAATARVSTPLITPNTQKDLPSSPRLAARRVGGSSGAFWGGSNVNSPFNAGGFTPVHTTLVPEFAINLGKSVLANNNSGANIASSNPAVAQARMEKSMGMAGGENINPLMNYIAENIKGSSPSNVQPNGNGVGAGGNVTRTGLFGQPGFDGFSEMSPFTMKSMDQYRMQLWSRMAMQQAIMRRQAEMAAGAASPTSSYSSPSPPPTMSNLTGHASNMRPLHMLSPTEPGQGKKLGLHSPPSSPKLSAASSGLVGHGANGLASGSSSNGPQPTTQQAMLAGLAGQTFVQKLGQAFWDAFSGSSSKDAKPRIGAAAATNAVKSLDAEKVRKVLEGKAVLRVVDIDGPSSSSSSPTTMPMPLKKEIKKEEKEMSACNINIAACFSSDTLAEAMGTLSIAGHAKGARRS